MSGSRANARSMATSKLKSPSKVRRTIKANEKSLPPGLIKPPKLSLAARRALSDTIFARLSKITPDPKCELFYTTPFQLLVSVALSAQTTDKMVNACMQPVYEAGFTVDDAIRLGADGLLPLIQRIGFAPTKSKNVAKLARLLKDLHQSDVPHSRAALEALPGVGRKTANVILAEIFGEPTLAVDTHVFRVGARLGLHRAATPEKAELELLACVAEKYRPRAHHWLILHGRYTCKALRPECDRCVLRDLCPSLKR